MVARQSDTRPATAAKTTALAAASKRAAEALARTSAKKAAPAPVAQPDRSDATKAKHKLVRDSFTIPKSEYLVLDALKQRAAHLSRPVKKSELLRAGIGALNAMTDKAFLAAVNVVPSLKTGRPKHDKARDSAAKPT